jgi:hypothetical protein
MKNSRYEMEQNKMKSVALVAVPLVFLAAFSAWAEPDQVAEESATSAVESGTPEDNIGSSEGADATGLDIVMDGSSLEAFEQSMEQVKETGTALEYKSLTGAIDYLLIYDIGAKNNMKLLATRLNGITAGEVIQRVNWRKP